jgi:hypothetical protein
VKDDSLGHFKEARVMSEQEKQKRENMLRRY